MAHPPVDRLLRERQNTAFFYPGELLRSQPALSKIVQRLSGYFDVSRIFETSECAIETKRNSEMNPHGKLNEQKEAVGVR
jgi:hypothetical protein